MFKHVIEKSFVSVAKTNRKTSKDHENKLADYANNYQINRLVHIKNRNFNSEIIIANKQYRPEDQSN